MARPAAGAAAAVGDGSAITRAAGELSSRLMGIAALSSALILLMSTARQPFPPAVHAVSTSQAYRRTVVEDAELTDAATLTNGTLKNSTLIQCAGWCSKRSTCAAYSFRRSSVYCGGGGGDRGFCRLGTNPHDRRRRAGSKVYYMSDDSDPTQGDGFTYFRIAAAFTFRNVRSYCIYTERGNLPVVYPNSISFRKMNSSFLYPTDKAFVDMRSIGDYKFITGLGEVFDARNKDADPNQHWAPGKPSVQLANSSGTLVLMSRAGWEDVPATATSTVIMCQSDAASYRLLPDTGKYYAIKKPANVPDARRNCLADGGTLAMTYGTADGRFAVRDEYGPQIHTDYLIVSGAMNVVPFKVMEFEDGTRLNYTNTASVNADQRQKWTTLFRYAHHNCLYMHWAGWMDYICYEAKYHLCERDVP